MKRWPCAAAALCVAALPMGAWASAWPQQRGHTEIIASFEPGWAGKAFDAHGRANQSLGGWTQDEASLYVDQGITARMSLTAKINLKAYDTSGSQFSGLSSIEIGARYAIHAKSDYVLAVGGSLEGLGRGRRNDFDSLYGRQGTDADLRLFFGKNLRLAGEDAFVDLQGARHIREYNPDEWRMDATLGLKPSLRWMLMAQAFAGRADSEDGYRTQWLNAQLSVVRNFGPRQQTALQLGIRQTLGGLNVPQAKALIVSLWRRY